MLEGAVTPLRGALPTTGPLTVAVRSFLANPDCRYSFAVDWTSVVVCYLPVHAAVDVGRRAKPTPTGSKQYSRYIT